MIGLAVWVVILATAPLRRPDWEVMPETFKGTIFLLALVTCASMMPVEKLPAASWQTALGLGFVSAVFDNIPLTALALKQGGYDWGFLAYAVGFGGSMIWFGSSAGVALANMYPEAKSVGLWLRHGWHVRSPTSSASSSCSPCSAGTRTPTQEARGCAAAAHGGRCLLSPSETLKSAGGPGRSRTCDLRFRKPLLYPLSYGTPAAI